MRLFQTVFLLLALGVMAACSRYPDHGTYVPNAAPHTSPAKPHISLEACRRFPALEKYHCSILQLEQAAHRGDANAQYTLGYLYFYGIGVAPSRDSAHYWIEQAASQDHRQALKAMQLFRSERLQRSPARTIEPEQHEDVIPKEPIQKHLPAYPNQSVKHDQPHSRDLRLASF